MLENLKRRNDFFRVILLMRYRLIIYFTATLLSALVATLCLNAVMAFMLKDILNAAMQQEVSLLKHALFMALGAFFIGVPLRSLLEYIRQWSVIKTIAEFQERYFEKMTYLSVSRFEKVHSGDLLTRLTSNIESIENVYLRDLPLLLNSITFSGFALILIFYLEWRMGLLILAVNLASLFVGIAFKKPARKVSSRIQQEQAATTERFLDLLQGITVTKMFNIADEIRKRYIERNNRLSDAYVKSASINALAALSVNFYSAFKYLGILSLGLYLVMQKQIDLGSIGAIIFVQEWVGFFFEGLGLFLPQVQESIAGVSRVFELLDWSSEDDNIAIHGIEFKRSNSTVFDNLEGKDAKRLLEIRNVTFCYQDNNGIDTQVLRGLHFSVEKGLTVALVGLSGSGKSTIVKLLMGFYSVNDGDIFIDGKKIKEYSLQQLRSMFAYVPQEAYLFEGTIKENIAYGRPKASTEEIVHAAKMANAHDFIIEQPNGYDTAIGEMGAKLSGGQKQRITIARALLKNAPILLLDEATSALDSESERLVQEALNNLMKGRTTIVIAHRLSTIRDVDVICVIDSGKIVEQGTHNDLIAKGGLYAHFYYPQSLVNPSC